jgi:hypothetical protein
VRITTHTHVAVIALAHVESAMTLSVEPLNKTTGQGIWCDPPAQDDEPSEVCDAVAEGLLSTALTSRPRGCREKCRWQPAAVTRITRLLWTEGQAWPEAGPLRWRREAATRGDASKGGADDGRPGV